MLTDELFDEEKPEEWQLELLSLIRRKKEEREILRKLQERVDHPEVSHNEAGLGNNDIFHEEKNSEKQF